MKKLNQVNFLESRSWPLTLALGLIFVIVLSLSMNNISNGFLILLLMLLTLFKIEWSSISMMNTLIESSVKKVKSRNYTSIMTKTKPKNKNTYSSHPRHQNVFKDKDTGDLFITEINITHSHLTKGIKNIHVGINDNELAFVPVNKLKMYRLANETEKNKFLELLLQNNYSHKLEQQIDNEKLTNFVGQMLRDDGYNVDIPLVPWNSSLDDYILVIQNTNLGKELIEVINQD